MFRALKLVIKLVKGIVKFLIKLIKNPKEAIEEASFAVLKIILAYGAIKALKAKIEDKIKSLHQANKVTVSKRRALDERNKLIPSSRIYGVPTIQATVSTAEVIYTNPVKGVYGISSEYGEPRVRKGVKGVHHGIDIPVPVGTEVVAVARGVIDFVGSGDAEGNYIRIKHADGMISYYMHLSAFVPALQVGKTVSRGELLGYSGNTGHSEGPHLHFAMKKNGEWVDPTEHIKSHTRVIESIDNVMPSLVTPRDIQGKSPYYPVPATSIDPWLVKVPSAFKQRVEDALRIDYGQSALARFREKEKYVVAIFDKYQVPTPISILCVMESRCLADIKSKAGAVGWWQFMPETARWLDLTVDSTRDDRTDPLIASDAAARYLRYLYGLFGSWILAVSAYNMGQGNMNKCVQKCKSDSPWDILETYRSIKPRGYEENILYFPKLMALWHKFNMVSGISYESIEDILNKERAKAAGLASTVVIEGSSPSRRS